MELTKSEMEIMDVLWEDGGALSRADFLERQKEKSWKDSSIHILLNGLLNKGAIREAGVVKRSKTYGRTFYTDTGLRCDWAASGIEFVVDCEGDVALSYMATVPGGHFQAQPVVHLRTENGRKSLVGRTYQETGKPPVELDETDFTRVLKEEFGIEM